MEFQPYDAKGRIDCRTNDDAVCGPAKDRRENA